MVISSDGANAYALSDSGFITLPLSTLAQSPIAVPASRVAMVTNDPCGVTAATATATVSDDEPGQGIVLRVGAGLSRLPLRVGIFNPGGHDQRRPRRPA